jgi:hypothetical protein
MISLLPGNSDHETGSITTASACTCCKSNSHILALGEGYAGFALRHSYGAVFRASSFVLSDEDGRPPARDARILVRTYRDVKSDVDLPWRCG